MADQADIDWLAAPAFLWDGAVARPVDTITAPPFDLLKGIDDQKRRALENITRHAACVAAHDMLLWGSRGMGKSALIRSAVAALDPGAIALVQLSADRLDSLPALFARLHGIERQFLLFVDDLGFAPGDLAGPRRLRSLLEGGVEARPGNVRLAVTTNHRAILPRELESAHSPRHERDAADDELALADRFGLVLGFHACDQQTYLAIVAAYAAHHSLNGARKRRCNGRNSEAHDRAAWPGNISSNAPGTPVGRSSPASFAHILAIS